MVIEACQKYQIDIILLNKTNTKWTSVYLDKIEKVLKLLGRETIIIGANSSSQSTLVMEYLPGGLLLIFRGSSVSLIQDKSIKKETQAIGWQ